MSNDFVEGTKPECAAIMEAHVPGTKTLFYGHMGDRSLWAFTVEGGLPGVALADPGGQLVINIEHLRELTALMEKALCEETKSNS